MILEYNIEMYILPYVKQITSPSSMHETGHSKVVHWDNTQGWDGDAGEKEVWDEEHMHIYSRFMSMYGKTTTILASN